MIFTYFAWEQFCKSIAENDIMSVTAKSLLSDGTRGILLKSRWVNLKHDVESTPTKALRIAQIEAKYGHKATYYVQSYLMIKENQQLFKEIQDLGHEVTYHHDVMDGSKGNIDDALVIFNENLNNFEQLGFMVETVCQHGNPMTDFDNRDFFKNAIVQSRYPQMADIMVNFKELLRQDYVYVSDVGMSFKIVNDPYNIGNNPNNPYSVLGNLNNVLYEINAHPETNYIISSHPHRYYQSAFVAWLKRAFFNTIRGIANVLFKIPGLKKFLFRFNFISKKL